MSVNGRLLHSGHAWIELKRLHMSRIGSWLVFQFPRRSVSPRVNPFLFFKSSVVISSSTFNDVLSLSLSLLEMKGESLDLIPPDRELGRRNRAPKRGNASLNYLWSERDTVSGKSREAKRFRFVPVAYITFLLLENTLLQCDGFDWISRINVDQDPN